MKKLLLILFSALSIMSYGQTVIQYDYMETWTWPGYWAGFSTTSGWYTNASVSPTESAVIYGLGSGSSAEELDIYILPNITGLYPNKLYQFRFRLASYSFTGSASSGVDGSSSNLDRVDVWVSTDGELNYTRELRIRGNSNSQFPYSSTGIITHTANGSFTNSDAPVGDVYQTPAGSNTTGPSTIILDLPLGITEVAVDILFRVNSIGEEWWIDNIELVEINPLPIELISFDGDAFDSYNLLTWSSASEHNNDYYLLERSTDGHNWYVINNQKGAGNSTTQIDYIFRDFTYEPTINYYRLSQVDFDGQSETFKVIAINNLGKTKQILFLTNMLGQIVGDEAVGVLIVHYSDGTNEKIYK